ncbi:hypothetical protein [Halobaculum roseum]|uniref:Uncharacterized protein n=1 Tax=Halobaculum roseum TaxID=2175149 RepID=A0ABD5MLM8_9EURY|nr:hypothetical protein [Halobaculum roseum]QZY03906.1 hypothetical protein K6T36_07020 [Halobaculum roseum]
MSYREHLPETEGYPRAAIAINALVAIAVTALVLWWAADFAVFYEELFRIQPVAEGANAGVGSDWTSGNQIAWLDFLIAITHAADVIMGVFILFMVFLHWGAFRRLASRMRQPGDSGSSAVAADGGQVEGGTTAGDATTAENAGGDTAGDDGGETA